MADATSQLNILVKVRDEASNALSRLSGDVSELGGQFNFASLSAAGLASAVAAAAAGAIALGVKHFADAEVQMARFDAIVRTLPANLQAYRSKMLEVADSAIAFGFGNEEAALTIARFFQVLGDPDLAFAAFGAAMDLARFKGISLAEAGQAIIMAFQGNTRLLKQLGIDVDEHASKETILAAIFQAVGGQADAYRHTLQGMWDVFKEMGGEILEAFGAPFAEAMKGVMQKILDWVAAQGGINALLEKHAEVIRYVAYLVGGALVVALGILAVMFVAAASALMALVGVSTAFVAVLIAVGAAVIAFVALMVRHWDGLVWMFKQNMANIGESIKAGWESVKKWTGEAVDWLLKKLEPLIKAFNTIKDGVSGAVGTAVGLGKGAWNSAKGALGINDGIVQNGRIITTHPDDYIMAAKDPGTFGGRGGGINITIQGDVYGGTEVAEKFGNEMARIIRYQLKLS